ncbi:sugar phosphate isomerase/epimerase family protein [Diplocloster hominis]|uniref:sugar phosphate isomerase/epimerase family protein n=1 Tax=Diplocloster hominis TaxID=3079010 RepID=UPI0031BACC4C
MFKVSVVTDELSSDFETAAELAAGWGISSIEIRGVGEERIGSLSPYALHHVKKVIEDYGLQVACVSPGIFKADHHRPVFDGWTVLKWQDRCEFEQQERQKQFIEHQVREVLPRTLEFCAGTGCRKIILFSFNKPGGAASRAEIPNYLFPYFTMACELAKPYDITLLIENEHICYGDTAARTRKLIESVGADNLKLNWDPGNAYFAGEQPYPSGYEQIRDLIGHVHMKDAVTHSDGSKEYVVRGELDWESQLKSLIHDGYDGYVSIETHCRPKVQSVYDTLRRILRIAGEGVLDAK